MSDNLLHGSCNCGRVVFTAEGPFRPPRACHCRSCRRQSGHYLAATRIRREGLTFLQGESDLRWFCATARARRGFCQDCGTHLFWEDAGSEHISIYMGCLDAPTGMQLADHIFVAEKGDYYEIADRLPQCPKGAGSGT